MIPSPEWARPRWSTPRTPDRPTYGPAVATVAERLGVPLLGWQRHVEDVAGEVLESGRMAYPVVVCIVPRRAGKTLATVARSIQRCAIEPRVKSWYTAQTGGDAGTTFREEWVPLVKGSRLGRSIKTRLSNGSEGMTLANGSRIGLFPPTEKALHGQAGDHVVVDEAWSFDDLKGTQIESAIRPVMITRRRRQLWIISAGGTDASTWLLKYRELGRALGIKPDQGLAYFEWHPEIDAEGEVVEDLDDPAVWLRTHPAAGSTIDVEALAEDKATMGDDVFYRAYLNVFQSAAGVRLIPESSWKACRDPASSLEPVRGMPIGFDVALDYSAASIVAAVPAGVDDVGRQVHQVEQLASIDGTTGLTDRLVELRRKYGGRLVANGAGPVRSTTAELRELGEEVEELTEREFVDASGELLRDVVNGTFRHRGQGPLDAGAAGAGRRELGDGWAFTRKRSTSEASPIVAASCALYRARRGGLAPAAFIRTASDAA